jgi:DNA repair exonuclease SbcCD ATPase subunit
MSEETDQKIVSDISNKLRLITDALVSKVTKLEEANKQQRDIIQNLTDQLDAVTTARQSDRARINKLEQKASNTVGQVAILEVSNQIDILKKKVESFYMELGTNRQTIQELDTKLNACEQNLSQRFDTELGTNRQTIQKLDTELKTLEQNLSQRLDTELGTNRQTIQELDTKLNACEQNLSQRLDTELNVSEQHLSQKLDTELKTLEQHLSQRLDTELNVSEQHLSQKLDTELKTLEQHLNQRLDTELNVSEQHLSQKLDTELKTLEQLTQQKIQHSELQLPQQIKLDSDEKKILALNLEKNINYALLPRLKHNSFPGVRRPVNSEELIYLILETRHEVNQLVIQYDNITRSK